MIPTMAMTIANSVSLRSFSPMEGPIAVLLSTMKPLAGNSFLKIPSTDSVIFSRSVVLLRILTRSLLPSLISCSSTSFSPLAVRAFLASSMVMAWLNRSCMAVPPEKSIPMLASPRAIWMMPIIPIMEMIPEIMNEILRLPMKSIRVLPMNSMPILPLLYAKFFHPPAAQGSVEHDLGPDQRGKQVDDDTEAQGDREPLDRAGAELKEDRRRDQGGDM